MRICIVAEGCYPYLVGGVSSWVHSMIKQFPDYQFVILAIVANRSFRGKFKYELPENVIEVHELYLEDYDWTGDFGRHHRAIKLKNKEYDALKSLLLNQNVDWETLIHLFTGKKFSLNDFLMGEDFFQAVLECYQIRYPEILFRTSCGRCVLCIFRFFTHSKWNCPRRIFITVLQPVMQAYLEVWQKSSMAANF